jgi:hypothetical protein
MTAEFLIAIQEFAPVAALRSSRWSYAAVNTAHIVGLALLLGAIVPLDLRLMGWRRTVPIAALTRVLLPVAIFGLALAILAGLTLFSVRASEYAALPLFWVEMALVACGVANAVLLRRVGAWEVQQTQTGVGPPMCLRAAGALSIVLWLSVGACGRLLAFVD